MDIPSHGPVANAALNSPLPASALPTEQIVAAVSRKNNWQHTYLSQTSLNAYPDKETTTGPGIQALMTGTVSDLYKEKVEAM